MAVLPLQEAIRVMTQQIVSRPDLVSVTWDHSPTYVLHVAPEDRDRVATVLGTSLSILEEFVRAVSAHRGRPATLLIAP